MKNVKLLFWLLPKVASLGFLMPCANASEGDSLWSQTYGGIYEDYAYSVIQTADGGYLLAGETYSFAALYYNSWIVKTDAQGDSLWSHSYGGLNPNFASSVIQTSDGGYLFVGGIQIIGTGFNMWLVKTDALGDSLWSRMYGGNSDDWAHDVLQTPDGGYLLAGATHSFGAGQEDIWVVKTNAQGDSIWSKRYGGPAYDEAESVIQTFDGGYLLGGWTESWGNGGADFWMVKISAQGDSLWSRTFGGTLYDRAYDAIQASDSGLLLAGYTESPGSDEMDMWLVKTDAQGNRLWSHNYGGSGPDWASSVLQSNDGGYVLAGELYISSIASADMWLVQTNAQGDSLWSCAYGGNGHDRAYSVIQNNFGEYLMAGWTGSFGAGSYDMWLVCVEGPYPARISLSPINPPIQIPASGGSFSFNATLVNQIASPFTIDVWVMVQLPSTIWYGPLLGPLTLALPSSTSINRLRVQNLPGSAPTGNYWYEARIGEYPNNIGDSSGFLVVKLPFGNGKWFDTWTNTGESINPGDVGAFSNFWTVPIPESFTISSSPNPFNPSTVIRYQIPDARQISLRVYDTAGRLVETLVDGWREAGGHQVTFDGTGLAAGVYLYRLVASGSEMTPTTATGKMVLLK